MRGGNQILAESSPLAKSHGIPPKSGYPARQFGRLVTLPRRGGFLSEPGILIQDALFIQQFALFRQSIDLVVSDYLAEG